jgi:hypothetical protein
LVGIYFSAIADATMLPDHAVRSMVWIINARSNTAGWCEFQTCSPKTGCSERPKWVVCHERVVTNIGGAQLYER